MQTIHTVSSLYPAGVSEQSAKKFSRMMREIEGFEPVSLEAAQAFADDECRELSKAAGSFDDLLVRHGLPVDSNDVGFEFDGGDLLAVTIDGCFWVR